MSNSIKLSPTHFSRGAKQFAGGAPLVTGLPLYDTLGPWLHLCTQAFIRGQLGFTGTIFF